VVTEAPVDQSALDSAIARAESARTHAVGVNASSYFPADWDSAETGYNAARGADADRSTAAGVQDAARRYNAAADAYDELYRKALPLYAGDLRDEVLRARAAAIEAGVDETAPEYLVPADTAALDAEDRYYAEDYDEADRAAHEALDRYRALKTGADAFQVRQIIMRQDFSGFDPDNFRRADEALIAAADAYEADAVADAMKNAEESKLRYDLVLKAGWASYAAQLQALARRERENAINAKADRAVKADFEAVDRVYTQAESAFRSSGYEEAAGLYIRSEAGFVAVTQAAEEKRLLAEAAIQAAEKKLAESEDAAQAAEVILEGGAR
jgi:hypothetical protein